MHWGGGHQDRIPKSGSLFWEGALFYLFILGVSKQPASRTMAEFIFRTYRIFDFKGWGGVRENGAASGAGLLAAPQ